MNSCGLPTALKQSKHVFKLYMRCEAKSGKHAPSVETRSNAKYSVFYAMKWIILCVILLYLLRSRKANFYVIHRQ